jgi:predicted small lipoprotein YifL
MGNQQKILVKAHALGARVASVVCAMGLFALTQGCGQRGPLTLPNDNDFKQRATLPDIVRRQLPDLSTTPTAPAPSQPASSTSAPAVAR